MQTTVTTKNMVTIPAELSRMMGITPGCRLEWQNPKEGSDRNDAAKPTKTAGEAVAHAQADPAGKAKGHRGRLLAAF